MDPKKALKFWTSQFRLHRREPDPDAQRLMRDAIIQIQWIVATRFG